ncbi:MAG: hypothetical protein AB1814_10310 [Thermodesulfobacteriota bacterium]
MTEVEIQAGACGFVTRVRADQKDGQSVSLAITSDCEAVAKLAEELGALGWDDLLRARFAQGPAAAVAGRCLKHAACPVLSGVLKCAEVELGLNLPREASIRFVPPA